jgi:hypothetical protein
MTLLQSGIAKPSLGYDIEQSLRFEDGDSAYLSRTPASAGNRKTWTWSGWVKRGNIGSYQALFGEGTGSQAAGYCFFRFDGNDVFSILGSPDGAVSSITWSSTPVYRDSSAWYHVVATLDTTTATAADRFKFYVNGVLQAGSFSATPALNADIEINRASAHQIGVVNATGLSNYFDGYLAEVNFIDGQALTPSDFGETNADTNQWVPIKYAGSYGTNGFYLNFNNSASLGADSSGNGNNFTPTNLAATDQVLDSPTNNFCTFNPLGISTYNKWNTASEGNLKLYGTGDNFGESTFHLSSGKWYFEVDLINSYGKDGTYITLAGPNDTYLSGSFEVILLNGVGTGDSPGLYGVAVDMDTGSWSTTRNGSAFGSGSFTPQDCKIGICNGNGAFAEEIVLNFGQDSSFAGNRTAQGNTDANGIGDFYYAPPSGGYLALCTSNLPNPSIALPGEHFNTVLYTGNGSSTQAITGVGFQPDFLWLKSRSAVENHMLADVVRGSTKRLISNATNAEDSNGVNSFDSDGFTTLTGGVWNTSSRTYVAWNWKADNTSGSTNTDGTITSTVSANTTAGFSIITYTGSGSYTSGTVGHGLSQAPDVVFIKKRVSNGSDGVRGWRVWHKDLNDAYFLALHATNAQFLDNSFGKLGDATYPYVAPTSSVIQLGGTQTGSYQEVNYSGDDYVMYCFHSVEGYSKVYSYEGNGSSTDNAFVYTGFRPAFILQKNADGASSWWLMHDNKRTPYNQAGTALGAQATNGDTTGFNIDILSNGFKVRDAEPSLGNSNTYIYLAFAESPFKYSKAR